MFPSLVPSLKEHSTLHGTQPLILGVIFRTIGAKRINETESPKFENYISVSTKFR